MHAAEKRSSSEDLPIRRENCKKNSTLFAVLVDPEAFENSAEDEKVEREKAVSAMRDRLAKLEELLREL